MCHELLNGHDSKQRLNVEYDVFSSVLNLKVSLATFNQLRTEALKVILEYSSIVS